MPIHFTGQPGGPFSCPLQNVPGYGSSSLHFAQSFTASMTPTSSRTTSRTYGFPQVSVAFYRAVSRPVMLAGRSSYFETIIVDAPVVYYRLDEGVGGFLDASLNGNTGVEVGTVIRSVAGALGDGNVAATFNGSSLIRVGGAQFPNDTKAFQSSVGSIEAWIKTTQMPDYAGIFAKGNAYGLMITNYAGVVYLATYNWGSFGSPGWKFSAGAVNDGAWHHVALIYRDSVTSGSQLYVDGVASGAAFSMSVAVQDQAFDIGGVYGTQFFIGSIDEPAFYNYALTPAQILNHYNVGLQVKTNLISVPRTSV